jgi:DHA1 family bicyclomycin/chloramphenicol resistance-like MFS transporter
VSTSPTADNQSSERLDVPLLILLSAASALSPFALIVLAPALNALAELYGVGAGQTQFMISAYLLGLACAQPTCGILCDRLGRRPVMLWGFAIFIVASVACALVERLDTLIVLRFLQAAGASVGTVTSRAIIRDLHDTNTAAKAMSYVAAAMGVSPIMAPAIGGLISTRYGPQSIFWLSAALGAIFWVWAVFRYPETSDPLSHDHPTLAQWAQSYRQLLVSRIFVGYSLMYGFSQGAFLTFMTVGAAVFVNELGLDESKFGITWGSVAIAYVAGATLCGKLASRYGPRRLLKFGLSLLFLSGWGFLGLLITQGVTFWTLTSSLIVLSLANGLVTPLSLNGALEYRPLIAGSSSGLSSAVGLVVAGAFTMVAGAVYSDSFLPIAVIMTMLTTLTATMGWVTRPEIQK